MIWSSSMINGVQMYRSACIWLVAALILVGGIGLLKGAISPAMATSRNANTNNRGCTEEHSNPSFGSDVVVGSGEVICSDLTTFGGTTVVQGEVKGNVVSFGGS